MNFDEGLSNALRREQPRAGFAERVLAAVAERRRRRTMRMWTVAAALVLGAFIGTAEVRSYEIHRRAETRKAGRELAIALKITGSKLHATTRMIRRRSNGV